AVRGATSWPARNALEPARMGLHARACSARAYLPLMSGTAAVALAHSPRAVASWRPFRSPPLPAMPAGLRLAPAPDPATASPAHGPEADAAALAAALAGGDQRAAPGGGDRARGAAAALAGAAPGAAPGGQLRPACPDRAHRPAHDQLPARLRRP